MTIEALFTRAPRDVDPGLVAPRADVRRLAATRLAGGRPVAYCEDFAFHTTGRAPAFFDITDTMCEVVRRSDVAHGHVLASTAHTTCALLVQENEPLLLADLADRLRRFAHPDEPYRHNDMEVRQINVCGPDECANGHSHCQHTLLGASVVLPIFDGVPRLGRWQRLLLVELDHPRPRQLSIQVVGLTGEVEREAEPRVA